MITYAKPPVVTFLQSPHAVKDCSRHPVYCVIINIVDLKLLSYLVRQSSLRVQSIVPSTEYTQLKDVMLTSREFLPLVYLHSCELLHIAMMSFVSLKQHVITICNTQKSKCKQKMLKTLLNSLEVNIRPISLLLWQLQAYIYYFSHTLECRKEHC